MPPSCPAGTTLLDRSVHERDDHVLVTASAAAGASRPVVGAVAVALGWFIADKLSRVLFPQYGPVPRIFWASAYLPAWLTAWLVSPHRRRTRVTH